MEPSNSTPQRSPLTNRQSRRLSEITFWFALTITIMSGMPWFEFDTTVLLGVWGSAISFLTLPQARNMFENRNQAKYGKYGQSVESPRQG